MTVTGPPKLRRAVAGVCLRRRAGISEVLLVSTGDGRRWILPKGTVRGAARERHVLRKEFRQEAGWEVTIIGFVCRILYRKRSGADQLVHVYLAEEIGRSDGAPERPARWFSVATALRRLTDNREQEHGNGDHLVHAVREALLLWPGGATKGG